MKTLAERHKEEITRLESKVKELEAQRDAECLEKNKLQLQVKELLEAKAMPEDIGGLKALLCGEFFVNAEVECLECMDIGEVSDGCADCLGTGTIVKRTVIPWAAIKALYQAIRKAVEGNKE